jgi:DNA topoisomerase-6 subunit B
VPFTSESKEAIADYDEIQKEITLALRECGRRLGLFVRRRERAASEFRRRNIFELYIEEVVEACNRLKGGTLPKQKLKEQLQKIATSRTGGQKTDEALGKTSAGPEGLPHSIIVTADGVEGETALATQVESSQGVVASTVEPDLLGNPSPADKSASKEKATKSSRAKDPPKKTTAKSVQIALYAGESKTKKKSSGKPTRSAKTAASRKSK